MRDGFWHATRVRILRQESNTKAILFTWRRVGSLVQTICLRATPIQMLHKLNRSTHRLKGEENVPLAPTDCGYVFTGRSQCRSKILGAESHHAAHRPPRRDLVTPSIGPSADRLDPLLGLSTCLSNSYTMPIGQLYTSQYMPPIISKPVMGNLSEACKCPFIKISQMQMMFCYPMLTAPFYKRHVTPRTLSRHSIVLTDSERTPRKGGKPQNICGRDITSNLT